jgi:hypothetical protein
MRRAFLASLFAIGLLATVPALAADDAYTLKLYKSKKGDKAEHAKTENSKLTILIDVGGMTKKEEKTEGKKEAYTEVILEKKPGDKRSTKLTRTYSVAEKTVGDETTKAPYTGETVLIEKKDGKYDLSIRGKELKKSDAPELYKQFNEKKDNDPTNEDFLPEQPIKVGGSWKVPTAKSEKMFKTLGEDNLKVDTKKSTITGKLLKVYKKDGVQFGVFEITITVLVTEIDLGGQFAKTTDGSKFVMKAIVDTCIDGTVDFEESKMEMTIDVTAEIPNVGSLTLRGTTTGTSKVRGVKK